MLKGLHDLRSGLMITGLVLKTPSIRKEDPSMIDLRFDFEAEIWLWSAKEAWHFVTLPQDQAEEIKFFAKNRNGFGSIKVNVTLGNSQWKTSIFPDSKSGSFVLPIKKDIRKTENIGVGDTITLSIDLMVDPF